MARVVSEGKLPADVLEQLKNLRGAALMAALLGGKMAGFALYIVANKVFFEVARKLGLGIGVAVAGPVIGRALAFLLGPAGWILTGVLIVFDLGNTNWKKVVPAIVMVIYLRRKIRLGDNGEALAVA